MSLVRTMGGLFLVVVVAAGMLALSCSKSSKTRIANPPLQIVTTSLPAGQVGIFYFGLVEASGGDPPVTWTVEAGSNLPPGLTLGTSGDITGTPSLTGNFPFDLRATDSFSSFETVSLSIDITAGAPLTIDTPSPLPNGNVAVFYSQQIMSSGGFGNHSYSITSGNFPPGLTINGASGLISGYPQVAAPSSFEITVTDSQTPVPNTAAKIFDLTIDPGIPADHLLVNELTTSGGFVEILNPTPNPQDLTGWSVEFYWYGFLIDRYFFPAFTLPPGEVIGVVQMNGVDQTAAPPYFVYTGWAFNFQSGVEHEIVLLDAASAGVDYIAINDVGTATHCPPNLNWTGIFNQGYDIGSGIFETDVIRTSFVDTDSADDLLGVEGSGTLATLNPGQGTSTIMVTSVSLWIGYTNLPYYRPMRALGGLPPYTFTAPNPGALPPGLVLDPLEGAVMGTPTAVGSYAFDVTVTDSASPPATDTRQVSVDIVAATPGLPTDIKVNEVDPGDPDWVEIANFGLGAVDLSGWYVKIIYERPLGDGHVIHIWIPRGVVLPTAQTLYFPEGTGGFPTQFEMGMGFSTPMLADLPGGCALIDQNYQCVDYMNYNFPTFPNEPPGTVWSGSVSMPGGGVAARSMFTPDSDTETDWCILGVATGTPAAANSNCP